MAAGPSATADGHAQAARPGSIIGRWRTREATTFVLPLAIPMPRRLGSSAAACVMASVMSGRIVMARRPRCAYCKKASTLPKGGRQPKCSVSTSKPGISVARLYRPNARSGSRRTKLIRNKLRATIEAGLQRDYVLFLSHDPFTRNATL